MQVNKQLARKLIPEAKEVVRKKGITKALAIELSRLSEEQQRDAVAKDSKKAIIAAICKSEQKGAKPWNVKTLLEKVRNTYEAYSDSEDKQKSLMAGLKEFMVEVGYIIEPDDVDTVGESDDEVVPEAEKNTDESDAVTSSENDPNKANESED